MKIKIKSGGFEKQEALLKRCLEERIPVSYAEGGMEIELAIDQTFAKAESFLISGADGLWKITGTDEIGLFHGIGKFLHTARWSEDAFLPNPPDGLVSPDCPFRAIYFANHFNGWYQEAPEAEIKAYVEELVLWGYNTVVAILPVIHFGSKEDPEYIAIAKTLKNIFRAAKNCSMKVGLIIALNQGMTTAPHEYDAVAPYDPMDMRPALGRNLCAANEKAVAYLRGVWNIMLEEIQEIGLDYMIAWPYDEGGCGCEKCRPWGSNGFARLLMEANKEVKKYFPECKIVGSTWYFDLPEEGEFEGFYKRLRTDLDFVDFVMADSFDAFPEYPLEHEPVKPVVSFPEISMWKLYPWGGRGANPQPKRFQRIWNSAKSLLQGGMPYSEGIFEDILKVQLAGYFWDKNRHYKDILSEYINYEYCGDVCADVLEIMELIEINHINVGSRLRAPALPVAQRAAQLADNVDARLPQRAKSAWRWRVLYIRTQIDKILYEYFCDTFDKNSKASICTLLDTPKEYLAHSAQAQKLLHELVDIYHCVQCPAQYLRVYPPIKERSIWKEINGTKVAVDE